VAGPSARADIPTWLRPGDTATLLWGSAAGRHPDGSRLYDIAGPMLEVPPASPAFLLAPPAREDFAERVYRGRAGLDDLRDFLGACALVRGELLEMELLLARDEVPALAVLDEWRGLPARPLVPYLEDIAAFMPEDVPIYVTPEAHRAAQSAAEMFGTAWVCEECGDAADAGVFLWTAAREDRVRVCLLLRNDVGVLTCHLHPFDFRRHGAAQEPA
jgi:hypothetical protein